MMCQSLLKLLLCVITLCSDGECLLRALHAPIIPRTDGDTGAGGEAWQKLGLALDYHTEVSGF